MVLSLKSHSHRSEELFKCGYIQDGFSTIPVKKKKDGFQNVLLFDVNLHLN